MAGLLDLLFIAPNVIHDSNPTLALQCTRPQPPKTLGVQRTDAHLPPVQTPSFWNFLAAVTIMNKDYLNYRLRKYEIERNTAFKPDFAQLSAADKSTIALDVHKNNKQVQNLKLFQYWVLTGISLYVVLSFKKTVDTNIRTVENFAEAGEILSQTVGNITKAIEWVVANGVILVNNVVIVSGSMINKLAVTALWAAKQLGYKPGDSGPVAPMFQTELSVSRRKGFRHNYRVPQSSPRAHRVYQATIEEIT
jgi:hypothetical protein